MDERQDSRQSSECPRWCAGEHDEIEPLQERLHRSPARTLPVVLWLERECEGGPAAALVHVSLCRRGARGEDRVRIESDGVGAVDFDPSSAARLARGVEATLGLLAPGA